MPEKGPELVQVDDGLEVVVLSDVEMPHTHLQAVYSVNFVESVDSKRL